MPDYGDDRGFRSRGVPANIGFDRAGPGRNYNEGYGQGDVTVSDLPPRMTTPIQMGGSRGEFAPPLYSERNPFIQPIQTGGRLGEFSQGIFGGGGRAHAANDIVDAIMGGMNRSQEGAEVDIAGGPGMVDKRMTDKLWGKAVNKFPPGTPDMIIQQEWERLKQIYFDKTYGPIPPTYVGPGSVGT